MPRARTLDVTAATARVGDTLMIGGTVHRVIGIAARDWHGGGTLSFASGLRLTLPPTVALPVTRPIPDHVNAPTPRTPR